MNKRDFNIALKYLAKGADDKQRAKFKAEIAKRAQDMDEARAIFEAGLQAYRLFNYYASECEKLGERISYLCEQIDALQDKAEPRDNHRWRAPLNGA